MRLFLRSCGAVFGLIGHLFLDFFRLIGGVWKLSKLNPPVVSIFGGAKLGQDHPYAVKARLLAEKLIEHDISVITGGGPGIMEAANCGASKVKSDTGARSIGITVSSLIREGNNPCTDEMIVTQYFFSRKWLLIRYSNAFTVFPGGFGTLDELFQILTLMQTNRLKRVTVILFDTGYWQPMMEWVNKAVEEGLMLKEDADLICVTDDIQYALGILHKYCEDMIPRP